MKMKGAREAKGGNRDAEGRGKGSVYKITVGIR